jgi:predicted nucleic acid-binding protein
MKTVTIDTNVLPASDLIALAKVQGYEVAVVSVTGREVGHGDVRLQRQLRDAMILEAHVRNGRDVFITDDKKAFINNGRRDALRSFLKTRILTKEEFLQELQS